ncbi:FAD-dependent oxidoreductase [Pseudonocardia asaccharolytica]|uniref:FAD-binding protein n=1 Tax=Pseudonocardia asaccharolytica DSM 44247 = NBRC 16224 TaxID=1123024 RepID=A0A511CY96_9PSEU|nr:FAD-dependent oxidoreductase [Pseudonocardia asaccharolytica]GEL17223.1 FAD-binding protein [Pseudonocardia asaccharolytica DSM 44247 = NBRC 16224]
MREVDVLVVGSGVAGLTAALAASLKGAEVAVMEKSAYIGGTSAMSGGVLWIPANRHMVSAGLADTGAEGLRYLERVTMGRVPIPVLSDYIDSAAGMLEFLEANTSLEFVSRSDHPDYLPESLGGRLGRGVQPKEWDPSPLAQAFELIRRSPSGWKEDLPDVEKPTPRRTFVSFGRALVGGLLFACLRNGVHVQTASPVVDLWFDNGRTRGVWIEHDAHRSKIGARCGVVLASGGFEWNQELVDTFLSVPLTMPVSSPSNTGDGLRMVMRAGAALANMGEAWWTPAIHIDGESYEDGPLNRFITGERSKPGSLMVNRRGRRFVRESMNYNDIARAMAAFDPLGCEYPNLPCFLIFDARYRESYSVAGITPADPTPRWMHESGSIDVLAARLGIDAVGLNCQIREFNMHAGRGVDLAFGRGSDLYDRYAGDPVVGVNPTLRPLGRGPYYGIELHIGALGTKGGPRIDRCGRVLDFGGAPIPGLYAAGNVTGSVMGPSYPGPGATLGPAATYGMKAGTTVVDDANFRS